MTSSTTMKDNTATHFNNHSIKRSTPLLPRMLGSRVHLCYATGSSKRFKPNLDSSRTRPSLDSVKEDIKTSIEASKKSWTSSCLNQDMSLHNVVKESTETGQAEGSGIGTIEDPDSDDSYPLRGLNKKSSQIKLSKLNPSPSATTSPETVSAESCEVPTELDLAQDSSYEVFSIPLNNQDSAVLIKDQWENILERLRQEKGLVCTAIRHSSESTYLTFTCEANHSFTVRSSEEFSCPKCELMMIKCLEYARANNGNIN